MATITAAMVKDLREKTGAGMMDCKAALTETGGDIEAAHRLAAQEGSLQGRQEVRPRRGRRPDRRVAIGRQAAWSSRSIPRPTSSPATSDFQGLVKMIAQVALDVGADVEKIKAAKVGGVTVEAAIANAIATIGENMTLRRAAVLEVRPGRGVELRPRRGHRRRSARSASSSRWNRPARPTSSLRSAARSRCMSPPPTRSRSMPSGLDPAVVEREKDVLRRQESPAGKPANVIEKIVESGLKTYYKEVCLLEQAFIHDTGKTVAQAVKEAEGKVGAPVEGRRLRALCARRGHREAGNRLRGRSRGRERRRSNGWNAAIRRCFAPDSGAPDEDSESHMAEPVYRRVVDQAVRRISRRQQWLRHRPADGRSRSPTI